MRTTVSVSLLRVQHGVFSGKEKHAGIVFEVLLTENDSRELRQSLGEQLLKQIFDGCWDKLQLTVYGRGSELT